MEKTISSRIGYQGPFFLIREHKIEYPDGTRGERMVLEHPGAVAALPLFSDDTILLVSQYRKALEETTLEIPAGKIETGESLEDCILRELREETGYSAGRLDFLISYFPSSGISSEIIHIFLARDLEESERGDFDEHSLSPVILRRKEVERLIGQGEIRDSKTIIALREGEHRGLI